MCQYSTECKESKYKDSSSKVDLALLDNYKEFAQIEKEVEATPVLKQLANIMSEIFHLLEKHQGTDQHCIIFNLFNKLQLIYSSNPKTYKVLLIKLLEPHLSYSEIALRINGSKQLVDFHLKKAKTLFPELSEAILIDTRKYPKSKKSA